MRNGSSLKHIKRRVIRVYYVNLLIMQIVCVHAGKFGAVFASIPGSIFAAIYCLLFAYVGMYRIKNYKLKEWVSFVVWSIYV